MERQGIVVRANSPWSSPLHMVKKPVGWRPCGDFCLLNMMTVKDTYQLPNIPDVSVSFFFEDAFWGYECGVDISKDDGQDSRGFGLHLCRSGQYINCVIIIFRAPASPPRDTTAPA